MRVEFVLRALGNHHSIGSRDLLTIPRVGEYVTFDQQQSHLVHEVTHHFPDENKNLHRVSVMLDP